MFALVFVFIIGDTPTGFRRRSRARRERGVGRCFPRTSAGGFIVIKLNVRPRLISRAYEVAPPARGSCNNGDERGDTCGADWVASLLSSELHVSQLMRT